MPLRAGCVINNDHANYTGSGFIASIEQRGSSFLTFTVPTTTAGMYTLTTRYALGLPYVRTLSVYVNGQDVTQALFTTTGTWDKWATQSVTVRLPVNTTPVGNQPAGNQITFRYDNDDNGRVNLDYLLVTPATTAGYATASAAATTWPTGLNVDQFTGTAQFAVPLFNLTAPGGLTVPIGLAYAATGVQVDDDGSGGHAGVNWALQAEPVIRRVVRGLPDDIKAPSGSGYDRYGWLYLGTNSAVAAALNTLPDASTTVSSSCTGTQDQAYTTLEQLGALPNAGSPATMYDTEPDIFYYSIAGHAGKFIIDQQGQAHTMPYDPISITWAGPVATLPSYGIPSFTIRTPEGATYLFGQPERVNQATAALTNVQFFRRDFLAYYLPGGSAGSNNLIYHTAWHASSITSATGGYINFDYRIDEPSFYDMPQGREQHRFLQGNSTALPTAEYQKTARRSRSVWLTSISSPTATASFEVTPVGAEGQGYCVQAINITGTQRLANDALLKRFVLTYTSVVPDYSTDRQWFDEQATPLAKGSARQFLSQLTVSNGYTTEPLYSFNYSQLNPPTSSSQGQRTSPLPPLGAVEQDYWGFYNANGAKTLVPQLYLYPQLATLSTPLPGAPYRLFDLAENATYAANGAQLAGADRRPAADSTTILAGTLTEITFAEGGKAMLEYEPHRFYDSYAQQTLPAGGVRVRTIKLLDPVTRTETRRDYQYQLVNGASAGRSSGVLLHAPQFAFAVPTTGTSTLQQWQDATVRCGDDMAADPLEGRMVGYQCVSELQIGRGQTVTYFNAPGTADESVTNNAGPAWQQPVIGVARQTDGNGNCPPLAPLPTGPALYPFALAPTLDYQRGLPSIIRTFAEPVRTAPGALVRQREFTYEYRALQSYPITSVTYERAGTSATAPYLFAKTSLPTGFQYALREEAVTVMQPNNSTAQLRTVNRYTQQGRLATTASQNSDGTYQRTRYRYLADYPVVASSTNDAMKALYRRHTDTNEQLDADIVETVSEVVKNGQVYFKEAVLQTFMADPPRPGKLDRTRPYQVWQRKAALPLPLASSVDSVSLPGDATYQGHLVATAQEVDDMFTTVSSRVEAGRQIKAQHLDVNSSLPVLQITGAKASEVAFSDFETTTNYRFTTSGGRPPSGPVVARTGEVCAALGAGQYASVSALPISEAPTYRLVWWGRANPAVSFAVSFLKYGTGGTLPPTPPSVHTQVAGVWQRFEVALDLSSIPATARAGYELRLTVNGDADLDDILLVPAEASTVSTTYTLGLGKTSETDDRGRTTYYGYTATGKLAVVRDHNQAIVRQLEQVVAGRRQANTLTPSFTVDGNRYDGETLTFTAYGPRRTDLEYQWDFHDGTNTSQTAWITAPFTYYTFNTNGQDQTYQVELRVRPRNTNAVYRVIQPVGIAKQPLRVMVTMRGVTGVDDCHNSPPTTNVPGATTTTFTATPSAPATAPNTYNYQWEISQTSGGYTSWVPIQGATSYQFVQTGIYSQYKVYRCRITDTSGTVDAYSEPIGIEHYGTCQCRCPSTSNPPTTP